MDHHNHQNHGKSSGVIGVSGESHSGHMGGMSHAMTFHFGSMEAILFNFWMPDSPLGMFFSCLIVILMCIAMESLRFWRNFRAVKRSITTNVSAEERLRYGPRCSSYVLMDSFLHLLQLTLAYCLMLIFMTFNVWLCVAILIGEVLTRLSYSILFPNMESGTNTCG